MPAPLILHVFSTFAMGGVQARFASIVNHFGPRWRHAIIAMDGNLTARARLDPALDVQFPEVEIRKGHTFANARRFRRVLRDMRPHALLTSNWGTIEWAIGNIIPVVRHVHAEDGFGPEEASGQLRRRVLMRRLVLGRRTVVLPSRKLWTIATETWRLNPRRLQYVPNGVDLSRFIPRLAEPAAVPVVGTIAALRPEKNLSRLLRAFHQTTLEAPSRLVIVGDGQERPALEALARELGIADRVEFRGHVNQPAACFREFDVFAMSSDTEQMPISLLEAMASGLPVAATDVGDIRTMLGAGNQPFVTPLDDAALAGALRALLQQPGLRRTVGQENRIQAEQQFDDRTMFDAWARLMDGTPPSAAA